MSHVFISYAREDSALLKKARKALREARRTGSIDVESMTAGVSFQEHIDEALRSARAVLVLLTPASAKSPYVTYEWSFALGAGIPVIPFVAKRADLHPRLKALHYLDASPGSDANAWDKLARRIRSISSAQAPPARSLSLEQPSPGPEIVAKFVLVRGKPSKLDSVSYRILLGTINVPDGTERVSYEIHDESFPKDERRFVVHWGPKDFAEEMNSWGDLFLSARGNGVAGKWRAQSTLVEALRRGYSGHARRTIKAAISELEKN